MRTISGQHYLGNGIGVRSWVLDFVDACSIGSDGILVAYLVFDRK